MLGDLGVGVFDVGADCFVCCDGRECVIEDVVNEVVVVLEDGVFFGSVWGWCFVREGEV